MRVAFCLSGPNSVNGPNVWLTRHLPLLAARGFEPRIIYVSRAPEEPCRYRALLQKAGFPTVTVRLEHFVEESARAIAEAADAMRADVFVPNYSVPAYFAARYLRDSGVVTVGTLHSDDPYYHDLIDMFISGPEGWRLSGVVGVSKYLEDVVSCRTSGAMPYLHAPYGAPIPDQRAVWSAGRFRLVYSGRFVERQKRVSRVAAAMLEAARRLPGVEGVLYGDGAERGRLAAGLLQSKGHVFLGGLLAPEEVQPAMLEGHAFVLLSDFEGLSIALMEAMACGLVPIITPMRSGVSDLVTDGVNGIVVPADDTEQFVFAVERLAKDGDLWSRMSAAARQAVEERGYTTTACAERWSGFIAELTALSSSRGVLSIPPAGTWKMPPRSSRPDGVRYEDRRVVWPRIEAVLAHGRAIYLWGASRGGEFFLDHEGARGLPIVGFIDSSPAREGKLLRSRPIHRPEFLLGLRPKPFVVITSMHEYEIAQTLTAFGFVEGEDFVSS